MQFNIRRFISLLLTIAFAVLSLSGIVMYIAPPGRVANWTNWTLMGLTKTQWGEIHTIFSILFVTSGITHLVYNWQVLISYLKDRMRQTYRLKAELLIAAVVCCICLFGAVFHVPPFGTVTDVGEAIKLSWEDTADKAPVPHTELKTVGEVAKEHGMQPDRVLLKLSHFGIEDASIDDTLADIAKANGTSPSNVYQIIQRRGVGIDK